MFFSLILRSLPSLSRGGVSKGEGKCTVPALVLRGFATLRTSG
ncbi:hypothetical protein CES86_2757 [Brucella lupini]|uniref:Uncharacterized protein n=1 Tax=Brucella lupini TaxID=255457 RepID=A0A256GPT7_9HYPH|nr:hypothetical protein CES86_2757 [Brucella lupini]